MRQRKFEKQSGRKCPADVEAGSRVFCSFLAKPIRRGEATRAIARTTRGTTSNNSKCKDSLAQRRKVAKEIR
jgi:GH24 family phage-related lysozyme (muramidase)